MKGNSGHYVYSDDNKTITLTNGNDSHYHQVFETADELGEFLNRVTTLGDEIFGEGEWTKDHPIEVGKYWYYGWTSKMDASHDSPPKLHLVDVWKTRSSLNGLTTITYVTASQFLYVQEFRGRGLWMPCDTPELPDINTLKDEL